MLGKQTKDQILHRPQREEKHFQPRPTDLVEHGLRFVIESREASLWWSLSQSDHFLWHPLVHCKFSD